MKLIYVLSLNNELIKLLKHSSNHLVWVKSKKLSPTANTFLEFIKKEKEKIIENEFNWINKLDI